MKNEGRGGRFTVQGATLITVEVKLELGAGSYLGVVYS